MNMLSFGRNNKTNIFLGLIEYELISLLGASHLVNYTSVHIRFDLESYLLNSEIFSSKSQLDETMASLRLRLVMWKGDG